eukprot:4456118-Pleurochrysis_carterae.AAC.1
MPPVDKLQDNQRPPAKQVGSCTATTSIGSKVFQSRYKAANMSEANIGSSMRPKHPQLASRYRQCVHSR